jgi:hypothetical protein
MQKVNALGESIAMAIWPKNFLRTKVCGEGIVVRMGPDVRHKHRAPYERRVSLEIAGECANDGGHLRKASTEYGVKS